MAARDGTLRRFGWYGLGAVRPTATLQFAARYDSWDRDLGGEQVLNNALERQMTIGGSYALAPTTKFAINVVRQTFPNVSSLRSGTFVLTAFQAVW
jgi:hypothetical protein